MKAYEVPRGAMIIVNEDARIPPGAWPVNAGETLVVLNLDGMYVNCLRENGQRVYIAAWTDVMLSA